MRPIKIMQVVPALNVGGVERGTIEFAQYLKSVGHVPIVVSSGGALVADLMAQKIQHITLNVNKKSPASLLSIKKLRQLISELEVDIVHARSRIPAWLSYLALKKMPNPKPKFVTTLHGLHSVSQYSAVMAKGDQVIAVSQAAKEYLLENFSGTLKSEPVVIHRGIDAQFNYGHQPSQSWLQAFQAAHAEILACKTVLLPGRLTRVKGVENLIQWLKQAPSQHKLLLTASPNESKYSRKTAALFKQQGVADKVVWIGLQRNMPDLYAFVDLVVSVNNKPESFGRAVLEALSIGTPVLGFSKGGVAEVLKQLYPTGLIMDENKLSEKIGYFLESAPAVEPHEQYKNSSMFEQTLGVYRGLLNE